MKNSEKIWRNDIMATVIKCDICGAEGAKHVRTLVNKKYSLDGKGLKELNEKIKNTKTSPSDGIHRQHNKQIKKKQKLNKTNK